MTAAAYSLIEKAARSVNRTTPLDEEPGIIPMAQRALNKILGEGIITIESVE